MPSPFKGQEGSVADFHFDWRLTEDPNIFQGGMEARMVGEFLYSDYACALAPDGFEFLTDVNVYS